MLFHKYFYIRNPHIQFLSIKRMIDEKWKALLLSLRVYKLKLPTHHCYLRDGIFFTVEIKQLDTQNYKQTKKTKKKMYPKNLIFHVKPAERASNNK